eukprot:TRINITY_DN4353_c0_g1_i1.p1 TRINITY_DN4353_c0_g1~~TRINITY_DN4353_c0_g1_i1.p1  ORF type:complete len:214 (-),score=11.33 TRINITY_DN4353_c0_g1_i1:99-740(-)
MHPIQCNSAHSAVWPGMDEFKLWWTAAAAFVSSSSYSCYRTIAFIWDHVLRVLAQLLTGLFRALGLLGAVLPALLEGAESDVVMFIFVVLAVEWVDIEAANYWGYTGLRASYHVLEWLQDISSWFMAFWATPLLEENSYGDAPGLWRVATQAYALVWKHRLISITIHDYSFGVMVSGCCSVLGISSSTFKMGDPDIGEVLFKLACQRSAVWQH